MKDQNAEILEQIDKAMKWPFIAIVILMIVIGFLVTEIRNLERAVVDINQDAHGKKIIEKYNLYK